MGCYHYIYTFDKVEVQISTSCFVRKIAIFCCFLEFLGTVFLRSGSSLAKRLHHEFSLLPTKFFWKFVMHLSRCPNKPMQCVHELSAAEALS